ncbi:nucleotide-diphospho-sugar transferase [Robertkochia sediminum]|uniref:nucleotide-diphospho-sugar transferase n=1 Tax=Robertkochia sediminum TaxID=2785326 RepID=UPI0019323395|nr:nucleotide-diphospho-sugar transferase [Robertkochia sediminum]MBL7473730.1 nucleotide-diphospho-sugar transferase [Robertkochia sediminum]
MKSPVLLITYKRLQGLREVLASVSRYRPKKLYLFSDGGRDEDEIGQVERVREYVLGAIDWECEVYTNFSEQNLGCKYGPQTAITWFFEHEESGIILEDDTVPNDSFYPFVEELLAKYRKDLRIWNIGGTNLGEDQEPDDPRSYTFSKFAYTWGWATWADRWKMHLSKMPYFLEESEYLKRVNVNEKALVANWINQAAVSYNDELDAWDYIWSLQVYMNNALSVVPKYNLIDYVGYDNDATHTKDGKNRKVISTIALDFPLTHPINPMPDSRYDVNLFENIFGWVPAYKKLLPGHLVRVVEARTRKIFELHRN